MIDEKNIQDDPSHDDPSQEPILPVASDPASIAPKSEPDAPANPEAPSSPAPEIPVSEAPAPTPEQKTAARHAASAASAQAAAKAEPDNASPFNITVGRVYDGPMDLLLDLIRKQDIDIYDIPIARITAQFLGYVENLKQADVDAAGEFIYTAALLIHIKSKMLLPRSPDEIAEGVDEDPRRELVERLLEHERFKNAAQMLAQKQQIEAATWTNPGMREFRDDAATEPEVAADTVDLVRVFREILERARTRPVLDIEEDAVTVGQMIRYVGRRLVMEDRPVALRRLLQNTRSERALICMFLALLELVRLQAILLRQDKNFSEVFIKKSIQFDSVMNEGLSQARDDWQ